MIFKIGGKTMNYLVTYADDLYKKAQRLCAYTGKKVAKFDAIFEFGPNDIDCNFRKDNEEILSYRRGNGLWLWKPYFILKALNDLQDGDILFYADSGVLFVRNFKKIFAQIESSEIWVTDLPLLEYQFTKNEVMTRMDADDIGITRQISASFIGIKKNERTVHFIENWLELCKDKKLLSPDISADKERKDFNQHREDQSILSLLCKKNGIKAYMDISEYGIYPDMYCIRKDVVFKPRDDNGYKIPFVIHYRRWKVLGRTLIKDAFLLCIPRRIGKKLIRRRKRMCWG